MSSESKTITADPKSDYRLEATRFVLATREAELLAMKGPCSNSTCRLHYAHSGPCDIKPTPTSGSPA